jgi:phosphatidate cytidylyltransferase
MIVSLGLICEQRTQGFLRSAASSAWGLLVTSYLLAHAVLLFALPEAANTVAGGAGWFLLLIMLTESNDIMQALVGRRIGRGKLAPIVSPHKTWEGFVGGVVSTVLLAMLLAPWLTPLTIWQAALGGLLISVGGLLGDLNISALKRDAGVKDSGTLLPGQGGILDRIDSLTFTAPLFYYFVRILFVPVLTP